MRVELEIESKTYFVEFKSTFTRREMKEWYAAQDLRFPERKRGAPPLTQEERDAIVTASEQAMLDLLDQWCGECYFEDVEGVVYTKISDLSPEILDGLDWSQLDFLFNIPVHARKQRSQLGNVVGLPQSAFTR